MTGQGFYEPKRLSPTGLALVVAMHAAALGSLALMKGPEFVRPLFPPTETTFIPLPDDPPPEPPQSRPDARPLQRPTTVPTRIPVTDPPVKGPEFVDRRPPPFPPPGDGGGMIGARPIDPPPPVRVAAQFDPRYAGSLQPPYPPSEQRAQREGSVRIQVTIGADGRVRAVRRLEATNDAFWRATERHALARWRFRPATLDGRPVESSKTMNVFFRIEA